MRRKTGTIAAVAVAVLLAVLVTAAIFSSGGDGKETAADVPAVSAPAPGPADLDGLSAREALALANAWGRSGKRVASHVDQRNVVFAFAGGETVSVPLPDDRMVVAVAPYVEKTHPCDIHAMSGCLGELVNVPVRVRASLPDGTVLINEEMRTLPNGFLELWLPRDRDVSLRIEALGRSAEGTVKTGDTGSTCVTTLRLS